MEYKVVVTEPAINDYYQITDYLLFHFSIKEVIVFDKLLAEKLLFLAVNPLAFPLAEHPKPHLRKCVINNKTVVLYDVQDDQVSILSLFDGRQNPEKLKIRFPIQQ